MPKGEWKDYYAWQGDDFLQVTGNPCAACGKKRTIGVVYGEEIKWWCAEHLPEEFWSCERKREAGRG